MIIGTILHRIEENKFYILYKRILPKNDVSQKYVIYRTEQFGGDLLENFYTLTEARKIFVKATKEAIEQDNIVDFICDN